MGNHRPAPIAHVVDDRERFQLEDEASPAAKPDPAPRSLRVAAADAEWGMDLFYQEMLLRLGHQVVVARDGRSLRELCRRTPLDLVLLDVQLPDGDGLETAQLIYADCPVPFLIVSAQQHPDLLARVEQAECVFGYLPKPITERQLAPAMTVAVARFRQLRQLRSGLAEGDRCPAELRRCLEERQLIENARAALMHRLGLRAADAFERMQRLAVHDDRGLTEIAHDILTAEQIFFLLEQSPNREHPQSEQRARPALKFHERGILRRTRA